MAVKRHSVIIQSAYDFLPVAPTCEGWVTFRMSFGPVNVLREALLPTALQTNLLEQFANDTMNIGEMSKLQPYTKVNGISLEFSNMTRGPEISCYIYDRWEKVIQMTCHHLDKWF